MDECPAGFQSTRPIRGATYITASPSQQTRYFNPRAPYGARPLIRTFSVRMASISIHAPHTGRDAARWIDGGQDGQDNFNPRAPYGARLVIGKYSRWQSARYFNPRAPYGARPENTLPENPTQSISIHAPHTGRDNKFEYKETIPVDISIHAPHTGRDAGTGRKA